MSFQLSLDSNGWAAPITVAAQSSVMNQIDQAQLLVNGTMVYTLQRAQGGSISTWMDDIADVANMMQGQALDVSSYLVGSASTGDQLSVAFYSGTGLSAFQIGSASNALALTVPSGSGSSGGSSGGSGGSSGGGVQLRGPLADQHRHFLQSADGTPVLASVMDMGEYLRSREEVIQDIFGNHLVTQPSDKMGDFTAGPSGNFSVTNKTSVDSLLAEIDAGLGSAAQQMYTSNWKAAVTSLQALKDEVLKDELQYRAGVITEADAAGTYTPVNGTAAQDIADLEALLGQTFNSAENPFRANGPAHGDAYSFDGDIYILVIDSAGGAVVPDDGKIAYPGDLSTYSAGDKELITVIDAGNESEWTGLEGANFLNGLAYFVKFNNHLELRAELYGEVREWRRILGDAANLPALDSVPAADYFGDPSYNPGVSDLDDALGLEYTDKATSHIPADSTIGGNSFAWTPESPAQAHVTVKEMLKYHIDKDVAKDASIGTLAGHIGTFHTSLGSGGGTGSNANPAQGFADQNELVRKGWQVTLGNGNSSLPESFVDMAMALEAAAEARVDRGCEYGQVGLGITLHGDDPAAGSDRPQLGIGWSEQTLQSGMPITSIVFVQGGSAGSPSAQLINNNKTLEITTSTNSQASAIKTAIDNLNISGIQTMLHVDGDMTDASVSSGGRLPQSAKDLVRVFDAVSGMSKVEWGLYLQMTPEQYDLDPSLRMISINGFLAAFWDDANSQYVQASERKLRPLDIMTYDISSS